MFFSCSDGLLFVTDRAEAFPTKTAIIDQMKIKNIINIWLPRFLLCVSVSLMISAKGWGQPTATIGGTTTVCQDAAQPNITFTGSNGTAPFTFTYTINSGGFLSVTTITGNSVTVPAPTGTAGVFTYALISVSDATLISNAQSGTAVVTVSPLPVPTITGLSATCQNSTGNIYTTEPGMSNYFWSLTGGTITAGNGTNTITVTWNTSGAQSVSVNYNNANNCPAASVTVYAVTVDPLPVPTITGPAAACINSTSNVYTTEPGMSFYTWSITAGGTITAGLGTRAITVTWSNLGAQSVSVNYNNANNCTAVSATVYAVTVDPLPVPTITGPASACATSTGTSYSTEAGMTGYTWAVTGGTITSGLATNSIVVNWNTLGAQSVSVNYNNVNNCTATLATVYAVTVDPLPVPTLTSSALGNTFCQGTSVTFTASGGTNYDFMVGATSVQNSASDIYTTTLLTNGQVVSVVVTNASGCSAASTGITNTVHPLPTATLTSSDADNIICQGTSVTFTAAGGGTNYDFMTGTTILQTGPAATYTTTGLTNGQEIHVVVTNSTGCMATSPSITTTVNTIPVPVLTSSDADNIFCAGTSVTFTASGGSNYNFRIGGISVQNGASNTFTTSSLTNGQIVDVVVNPTGCPATSTGITNTVNPQPIANAGPGGSVCGQSFKLNAVPSAGIGTWTKTTGPGTATFSPNANTAGATVTVSQYGPYTFTWTEVSGQCSSTSLVAVTFLLQPVANAGTGGNNCGLGFHLNGTMNAGTGTWAKVSGPGNISFAPDANTANALVTVTAFGTYTFSWTVINGTCSNSANVSVTFVQETPASGGLGGDVCIKSFTLNAMAPAIGTGTWSKYSGPGIATFLPDIHQTGAKVTVDQFGVYDFAWTVISGSCSSSDNIRVVFHGPPLLNAGRDTAMCKGGSVQLKAVGTGSVSWTPVKLLNNPGIINPIATPDTTTKFTINLTDQFGCKNADSVIVEVRNKVIADAGPDQVLNSVFTTQLQAKLAHIYERGIWSIISGTGEFNDSTSATTIVKGLSMGINKLLWSVTNGYCPTANDSTNITVKNFVIPTLITPNMDGRNDYFIVEGLTIQSKTEVIIFDRRGVQVYKNLNYDNSWNGVDKNNNPLPDDTYFYVLKYADGNSYRGYLVIRR